MENEKLMALAIAVGNGKATWHDFTEAFGAGSEHDPAVLGLRAYGGCATAAIQFINAVIDRPIWSMGSDGAGYSIATVLSHDDIELSDIGMHNEPARVLLLAAIFAKLNEIGYQKENR